MRRSCSSSIHPVSPTTDDGVSRAALAGAVLTGGASRRMGRTKALVEVGGIPMARRVADALGAAGCDPVVLVGGDPAELAPLKIPHVADRFPGEGPLDGVIRAIEVLCTRGAEGVLILGCDLPYVTRDVLVDLADAAGPGVDVVVARTHDLEPACAWWSVGALAAVSAMFDAGERSLRGALARLTVVEVVASADVVANVNEPGDLA